MNTSNKKIIELIHLVISRKGYTVVEDDQIDVNFLTTNGLLKKDTKNSNSFIVNDKFDLFQNALLRFAEDRLGATLPLDISQVLEFVKLFDERLKQNSQRNILNEFDFIVEPTRNHILIDLHNNRRLNLVDFYKLLPKERRERPKHLYSFERLFFKIIPFLNISIKELYQIIIDSYSDDKNKISIDNFCIDLGLNNYPKATELYEYGKKHGLFEIDLLIGQLLIGLHKNGFKGAFIEAKSFYKDYPITSIFFFGRMEFENIGEINECIELVKKVDDNDDIQLVNGLLYFYTNVLRSSQVNDELINYCFEKFKTFFDSDIKEIQIDIIRLLSWNIDNYEKEKYTFLIFILEKTKDISIINDYFSNFNNPDYFFHLFELVNYNSGFRVDVEVFDTPLYHFCGISKEKTEKLLLSFLSHEEYKLRRSTVKLALLGNNSFYQPNLLKLATEKEQLRVVEVILDYPYAIEPLLPIVLQLRKSSNKRVVKYLKEKLSVLIFESYHEYLYDMILKYIGEPKKERAFLKPIIQSLKDYNKIKAKKEKVKDLDPRENERDLMNLYYRLEHEDKTRQMKQMNKNSKIFLSRIPAITIVRGNSWKLDGKDEVEPLNEYRTAITFDKRMFKDTDMYEYNLENPKSNF
jgi:hypothetical protein